MKRPLALLLVAVMTLSMIPVMSGFTGKENASVNVGEWLALVDEEFGMSYYEQAEPYFENVTAENTYFKAVQIAAEWDVVSTDDEIDVLAPVKADFMAATLVNAAKLSEKAVEVKNAKSLYHPELVAIAAGNGIVSLSDSGKLDNAKITLAEGKEALAVAKQIWATKSFDEDKASVTPAENVKDFSDLPQSSELDDKYTVDKAYTEFEDGKEVEKEVITLPGTAKTAALTEGDVIVLPATEAHPFGALRKVTDVVASTAKVGGTTVFTATDNQTVDGTVTVECQEAELEEVFEGIDLQTDFAPDFQTAQVKDEDGEVINTPDLTATDGFSVVDSGIATTADETVMLNLLRNEDASQTLQCASLSKKPIDINFAVGDYAVSGKIDGDKMDFSVSAVIEGVKITKTYNFSNFNLSTKADINLIRAKIKEAYIRVDYDVVDSTKLEGNYSKDLANYNGLAQANLTDVDSALGTDIYGGLQGAADKLAASINNTFKIASVEIPIPNMPVVSIALDISLKINVDGSIELVVDSSNSRGYEIIDNQGRVINNTVNKENKVNLGADCQLTANFGIALKLLGLTVVDAGVETGIGVDANATIIWFTANGEVANNVTADIPIEVALTLTEGEKYSNVTGKITIYGILRCSVGQNSPILSKIGLARTWDIFNKDNAVIYEYSFDEGNIPEPATDAVDEITTAANQETEITQETEAVVSVAPSMSFTLEEGKAMSLADRGSAFASSDSSIAVVDANGDVTAVSEGTAKISGVLADGSAVAYEIVVTKAATVETTIVLVDAYRAVAATRAI